MADDRVLRDGRAFVFELDVQITAFRQNLRREAQDVGHLAREQPMFGVRPQPHLKLASLGCVQLAAAVDESLLDMRDFGDVEGDRHRVLVRKHESELLFAMRLQQCSEGAQLESSQGRNLSAFLSRLETQDKLTKTILYNLNPADNELFATMIGNFNDGSSPGKVQWGSGWWFLDQKDGMVKQINALSNMGLLSRFVGMLTDSRSFLSFPRHEYFRRILCNLFGEEIENGELPNDIAWTGKVIQDICYYNAKNYFGY